MLQDTAGLSENQFKLNYIFVSFVLFKKKKRDEKSVLFLCFLGEFNNK